MQKCRREANHQKIGQEDQHKRLTLNGYLNGDQRTNGDATTMKTRTTIQITLISVTKMRIRSWKPKLKEQTKLLLYILSLKLQMKLGQLKSLCCFLIKRVNYNKIRE